MQCMWHEKVNFPLQYLSGGNRSDTYLLIILILCTYYVGTGNAHRTLRGNYMEYLCMIRGRVTK